MAQTSMALLLLLLLLHALRSASAAVDAPPLDPGAALQQSLGAVESALGYLRSHIDDVNLDGLIGARAAEGDVGNILARYWTRLPGHIVRRLRRIQALAAAVNSAGIDVVRESTPRYYAKLRPILAPHFWDLSLDPRPIPPRLGPASAGPPRASFTERESDFCLRELYGEEGRLPGCNVSAGCWRKMTHSNYAFYSLTHQVFYLLNAVQAGCFEALRALARRWSGVASEREIMDRACARISQQAQELQKKGPSPLLRDLFMEQIAICGKAGYLGIARWQWLPLILSWQRRGGCYGTFGSELRLMRFLPHYGTERKRSPGLDRSKRVEKVMTKDGCLSHRTSVAIFSLTTYIRRLVPLVVSNAGLEDSL